MEASCEGGQGPEGTVAQYMEWNGLFNSLWDKPGGRNSMENLLLMATLICQVMTQIFRFLTTICQRQFIDKAWSMSAHSAVT